MDASEIEACLGKADDSAEMAQLFATLGVKRKPKLSSDGDARLKLPERGLLLAFEPEEPRSSKLKLVSAQFYSDSEEGFTAFAGALPKGLKFADTPKIAREKLGKPTEIMKEFRLDHWRKGDRQLTVRYRKSMDGIAYVMSGFPPDE